MTSWLRRVGLRFVFFFCSFVTLLQCYWAVRIPYAALLEHSPTIGVVLLVSFIIFLTLATVSAVLAAFVHPGVVPRWLAQAPLETFVRDVLHQLLDDQVKWEREATGPTQTDGAVALENERQAAVAAREAKERYTSVNALLSNSPTQDFSPGGGEVVNGRSPMVNTAVSSSQEGQDASSSHNDSRAVQPKRSALCQVMTRRRAERVRLGLPLTSMKERVSAVLNGLDADAETKEQEMSFLLRGAELCRICHIYQLCDTSHCSIQDRCIYRMDHLSVPMGQCVGYDTHKYFLLCVLYLCLMCVTTFVSSLIVLHNHWLVFFTVDAEDTDFFILFGLSLTGAILFGSLLAQCTIELGRGSTLRASIQEDDRATAETFVRRYTFSGVYRPLFQEDSREHDRPFHWANLRRAFGEGPVLPYFLLPLPPRRRSPEVVEAEFHDRLKWSIEALLLRTSDTTYGPGLFARAEADTLPGAGSGVSELVAVGGEDDEAAGEDALARFNQPAVVPSQSEQGRRVKSAIGSSPITTMSVTMGNTDTLGASGASNDVVGGEPMTFDMAGPLARLSARPPRT